jgi:hypothetical protein
MTDFWPAKASIEPFSPEDYLVMKLFLFLHEAIWLPFTWSGPFVYFYGLLVQVFT